MHVTRPPEEDESIDMTVPDSEHTHLVFEDEDPDMPTRPARRKAASPTPDISLQDIPHPPVKAKLTESLPSLGYFAAGGLSGVTSRTVTAPLDRLKVYLIAQTGSSAEAIAAVKKGAPLQATKHSMSTMWNACKAIWADGGIRSLFAGMFDLSKSCACVLMKHRQRFERYQSHPRVRGQVR